jgi:uncharacterized protein (TIRG00374 family)
MAEQNLDIEEQEGRPPKKKTILYIGLAVLIGLIVNIFMGMLMDGSKIWKSVSSVSIWAVIVPFVAYMMVSMVDSLRLFLVSRTCGFPVGFKDCILNSYVGAFFAHVTPLAMGGQPFQIVHLHHHGMTNRMATNIIFSRFVVNAMLVTLLLIIGLPVVISIFGNITGMAVVLYFGLAITSLFAVFFLLTLINPRIISWLSSHLNRTFLGRLVGKALKNVDWQADFEVWTAELRHEVRFLWSKGLHVMAIDSLLNLLNLVLYAFALWFALVAIVDPAISFLQMTVIYQAVWQVIFYLPSPGASGGLEGMFTLILSTMTGKTEMVLVAVAVWRFSTYYLSLVPGILLSGLAFRHKTPPAAGEAAQ